MGTNSVLHLKYKYKYENMKSVYKFKKLAISIICDLFALQTLIIIITISGETGADIAEHNRKSMFTTKLCPTDVKSLSILKDLYYPQCQKYYFGEDDERNKNESRHFEFYLYETPVEGWYRLVVKTTWNSLGLKTFGITAITENHHYVGDYSLKWPCPVPVEQINQDWVDVSRNCLTSTTLESPALFPEHNRLGVKAPQGRLGLFRLRKFSKTRSISTNVPHIAEFEVNFRFTMGDANDQRVSNRLNFVIFAIERESSEYLSSWNNQCYINHWSPVYSLGVPRSRSRQFDCQDLANTVSLRNFHDYPRHAPIFQKSFVMPRSLKHWNYFGDPSALFQASKRRVRRQENKLKVEGSTNKIELDRETCKAGDKNILSYIPLPLCTWYYEATKRDLNIFLAKMVSPSTDKYLFRLQLTATAGEGIKALIISALTVSRHFVGRFSLNDPCQTPSYEHMSQQSALCSSQPINANNDFVQKIDVKNLKPWLGIFTTKKGKELKGAESLILNFELGQFDQIVLGKTASGDFDPKRNKFVFFVSLQEWNNNPTNSKPGGADCLFNIPSEIYSVVGKPKEGIKCEDKKVLKFIDNIPNTPYDGTISLKTSPPSFTTTTPRTTTTTTKKSDDVKKTTLTTTTKTTPTTKKAFPFITVKPVIKDPNAVLPPFKRPEDPGYSDDSAKTEKPSESIEMKPDRFYIGCGKKKGCIGDPPGCLSTKSCSSVVTYGEDDEHVKFEVMGRSGKYVAVGLSWDKYMGNDSVVECVREYRVEINAYISWNFPRHRNVREDDQSAIDKVRGSYVDGYILCEFRRIRRSSHHDKKFDLSKDQFYVLHARGNTAGEGKFSNIGYHGEGSSSTSKKYNLHTRFRKTAFRIIADRIHGSLMIVAWMFLLPLSAFIARYYKETYKNHTVLGYTIWYAWHVVIAWLGVMATFLAMVCSVVGMELWNSGWDYFSRYQITFHCKAGIALAGLCFLKPFTGYAIKRINRSKRCQIMNYIHAICGQVSFWLAIVIIYRTTGMEGGLPCSGKFLVIAWIVIKLTFFLAMSYLVCYVDFVHGERISRAYNILLLRTAPHPPFEDVTGSPIRKFFLCLYICTFGTLTTAAIALFLSSEGCVEENIDY